VEAIAYRLHQALNLKDAPGHAKHQSQPAAQHPWSTASDHRYRPDIDGLRAIAVVLVVMYHLGVGFTKGGFVGVDVFFIISGFLITQIICADIREGRFSLVQFYERRVRRILPALFCVLLVTSVAGAFLLFPPELEYLGKALVAATVFVANILFYNGSGYFAGTSELVPLLHTWSLAVEEQFYLLYPLALAPLIRWRGGSRCVPTFALGAALSFASCLVLTKYERSAAFFLLPPRAWELLLGCLLALGAFPELRSRSQRQLASLVGLIAVLIAGGAFNRNVAFPGWAALLPCVGAVLVIHAGACGDTLVSRLLSSRGVVFIGLVSYSLYLWHWPIIVLYKSYVGFGITNLERFALGAISLAIAALSWRYVEQPFRRRLIFPRRRPLFLLAMTASATAAGVATLLIVTAGLAALYPEQVRQLANFRYDPNEAFRSGQCFISRAFSDSPSVSPECLRLDAKRRNVLLIGDSHAAHYWAGLSTVFPDTNFLQVTASGCTPTLGRGGAPRCRSVVDQAYLDFIPNHRLDGVIIAAKWVAADIGSVVRTIELVRQSTAMVYVFGPIVSYTDLLPRLLTRSEWLRDPSLVGRSREPNLKDVDRTFARAVTAAGARYVSIYDAMCDSADACMTRDVQGDPIQFDRGHLTKRGSIEVCSIIKERGILQ
jgi:peptidoglycan/LPS O-acetylase OafA/YrhL